MLATGKWVSGAIQQNPLEVYSHVLELGKKLEEVYSNHASKLSHNKDDTSTTPDEPTTTQLQMMSRRPMQSRSKN